VNLFLQFDSTNLLIRLYLHEQTHSRALVSAGKSAESAIQTSPWSRAIPQNPNADLQITFANGKCLLLPANHFRKRQMPFADLQITFANGKCLLLTCKSLLQTASAFC
jgi:hypothetical protein